MRDYLLHSRYRWAVAGLVILLVALWYQWFTSDQLISANLIVITTGLILLNISLGFFAYNRHAGAVRHLLIFSYLIIALTEYALASLTKGFR